MPIGPAYVLAHEQERIVIRNYEGKVFEYPELNESSGVPPTPAEPSGAPAVAACHNGELVHGCHCTPVG